MAIDFSFPPEVEDVRIRVRNFLDSEVKPVETDDLWEADQRRKLVETIILLRQKAQQSGLWLPHMPREWGGMGLGPTALAAVSSECARTRLGSFILNCQAPDEGNMHTLLHFGTDEQKAKYLKPLCKGIQRSCFAMTEPEVAGSDPTLIQTHAVLDGDDYVIHGHKWFISGAQGAHFAILIARTNPDAEIPQERNTAFIVETQSPGWTVVRDIETM
jgi:acyl-CoA dehydrogenase